MSRELLAHHPDLPEYRQDVYHVKGLRLCIGCFTVYPVFLAALGVLVLAAPPLAWSAWITLGFALAAAQAISALGWSRRRWSKVAVKTLLGLGLAAIVHGTLASSWPRLGQNAFLAFVLLLAYASTIPRSIRMKRAWQPAEAHREGVAQP